MKRVCEFKYLVKQNNNSSSISRRRKELRSRERPTYDQHCSIRDGAIARIAKMVTGLQPLWTNPWPWPYIFWLIEFGAPILDSTRKSKLSTTLFDRVDSFYHHVVFRLTFFTPLINGLDSNWVYSFYLTYQPNTNPTQANLLLYNSPTQLEPNLSIDQG